jgi:hypothetical protein
MASEESTEASERLLTRREELLLRIDFRELATLIEQALPNAARARWRWSWNGVRPPSPRTIGPRAARSG